MSDPTPEQQPRPPESPTWPGRGFAAPGGFAPPVGGAAAGPRANPWSTPTSYGASGQPTSYGAPGQPPPPPGYPAYPNQLGYPPAPQGYPTAYPAPAYATVATRSSVPGSTVVLLVLSLVGIVLTGIIGIPSAIIAALAWRQHSADPVAARRRTTSGWIWFAANFAVGILLLIPFYIWVSNNQ